MKNIVAILLSVLIFTIIASAQKKVTIYRSGIALSPTYSTPDSAVAAAASGDSLVFSADTFLVKSVNSFSKKLYFKGTMTASDSTIIDGQGSELGFIVNAQSTIKDIIFQNCDCALRVVVHSGTILDTFRISGNTIFRNNHNNSKHRFGVISCYGVNLLLEDSVKIINNYNCTHVISGTCWIFTMRGNSLIENNQCTGLGIYKDPITTHVYTSSFGETTGLITVMYGFRLSGNASIINNTTDTGISAGIQLTYGSGFYTKSYIGAGVHISGNKILDTAYGKGAAISITNINSIGYELVIDSAIFENNTANAGGAIFLDSAIKATINNTLFKGNSSKKGGAIYTSSDLSIKNSNFINNKADIAAAIFINTKVNSFGSSKFLNISSNRFFDRDASGKRPNEIFATYAPATFLPPSIIVKENWWGKNDTINSFRESPLGLVTFVNFAKTNWSIKDGLPIVKGDTNFTIGSLMKPNTIGVFPKNSLPMLRGYYFVDTGKVIPNTSTTDSNNFVGTMYHTFADSSFKSATCNVLAYIDEDTFRATILVWSKDTTTNDTTTNITNLSALKTFVYPNPFADNLHIEGLDGKNNIFIYDVLGKVVFKEEAKESSVDVSLSHLLKGIYLLSIHSDDGRIGQSKILKE